MSTEHVRIQAYLDGELSAAGTAAAEAHLRHCDRCRAALRAAEETWQAVDAARPAVPAPDLWPDLAGRLARRRAGRWSWPQRGLAVAAATVGVVVGLNLGGTMPTESVSTRPDLAAAADDYLDTRLPTLDQSWLLVGDLDEDAGS
jgi:anti-sigma factor RsiW